MDEKPTLRPIYPQDNLPADDAQLAETRRVQQIRSAQSKLGSTLAKQEAIQYDERQQRSSQYGRSTFFGETEPGRPPWKQKFDTYANYFVVTLAIASAITLGIIISIT